MSQPDSLVSKIASLQNRQRYQELHWEGSFEDYLEIVKKDPRVARPRSPDHRPQCPARA